MAVERNIDIRVRLKGADQFKRGMKTVNAELGSTKNWLDVTKGLLASTIIREGFRFIVNQMKNAADASIEFESALAGVAKTTDFSEVGLQDFGNQLMDLSERIPATAVELAGLAEIAGQLGIAKEDIIEFTEVVAAMGVSTNVSAEEAATAFARIANIFGTSSKDYSKLGSVVVDLGNNFATTEAEIIEMQKNMSGMAALVGMTEADVLAFSTALSSIGIEAAAGGSAMQRLFQNIEMMAAEGGGSLNQLAATAGMTTEAFEELWQSDPAQAVNKFVVGLNNINNSGGNTLQILEELDIKEIRLIRAVLGLANANDLLGNALEMSRAAWESNTALTEEAGKRYETTASRIQIAQNKVTNAQAIAGEGIANLELAAKETLGDIAEDWGEKRRTIDLAETVSNATKAYEAQKKAIDDNARSARFLVDSLKNMGTPETLDATQQKEYAATMTALVNLIPEINGLWNQETMAITGGTDALYRNIDAVHALQTAEAELEKSREEADAYAIIEQHVEAQRAQLMAYEAEIKTAQQNYDEFIRKTETEAQQGGISVDAGDLIQKANEHQKYVEEATANADALRAKITEGEALLQEYSYLVDDFEQNAQDTADAYSNLSAATEGVSADQQKAAAGLEYLSGILDEAIAKYQTAEAEILKTISEIADGFSKIDIPEIEGPEDTIAGMDSQLEFLNAYSEALQKAQEMGVDANILAQLATGDTKDYETLAGIVSGTEEDVATINAKYAEISAAKVTLAEELAAAQTDMGATVANVTTLANDLVDGVDVSTDMYEKGANDIQKLIDGMNSRISALRLTTANVHNITDRLTGTTAPDGSHAAGLAYVPHDGYIAELHKGEMVLTALAAKAYRAEQFANYAIPAVMERNENGERRYTTTNNYTNNISGINMQEMDADMLAEKIARANKRKARGRGYV